MSDSVDPPLNEELRELMAKREEAFAALRAAEIEIAQRRAELSRIAAEVIRKDDTGRLAVVVMHRVARW